MPFRFFVGPRLRARCQQAVFSALALVVFAQTPSRNSPSANQPPSKSTLQPTAPLIIIDPAHGGSDSGAALNAGMPEKDVTLVFARRLRQELASRSIPSRLLRDADETLTADQRAEAVNGLHPALYLVVHATTLGSGLRLYSALLPQGSSDRGPFLDWRTAQASALRSSQAAEAQIMRTLQNGSVQTRSSSAFLRPLNNIVVPALAVELAPINGDVSQLASTDYQQRVCSALANAIASTVATLTSPRTPQQ